MSWNSFDNGDCLGVFVHLYDTIIIQPKQLSINTVKL